MINSDTILTIGKTHKLCEDYIISGDKPYPFLIICDGCSSSKDTDIGARILAISIKNTLKLLHNDPYSDGKIFPNYKELGTMSINFAKLIITDLGLPLTALDATAVVAMMDGTQVTVYVYGDGVLISKTANGFNFVDVSFSNGAPYYLSYALDPARHIVYRQAAEKEEHPIKVVQGDFNGDSSFDDIKYYNYNEPLVFNYHLDDFKDAFVGISSDGIDSFVDSNTGERVPLKPIVEELFTFKNYSGEFVKRRVKRAIETFAKNGIYHADDISVGVLLKTEE